MRPLKTQQPLGAICKTLGRYKGAPMLAEFTETEQHKRALRLPALSLVDVMAAPGTASHAVIPARRRQRWEHCSSGPAWATC